MPRCDLVIAHGGFGTVLTERAAAPRSVSVAWWSQGSEQREGFARRYSNR